MSSASPNEKKKTWTFSLQQITVLSWLLYCTPFWQNRWEHKESRFFFCLYLCRGPLLVSLFFIVVLWWKMTLCVATFVRGWITRGSSKSLAVNKLLSSCHKYQHHHQQQFPQLSCLILCKGHPNHGSTRGVRYLVTRPFDDRTRVWKKAVQVKFILHAAFIWWLQSVQPISICKCFPSWPVDGCSDLIWQPEI